MAKRGIFKISGNHLQKEAFVGALIPLLRIALPYLGRGAAELAKTYAVKNMIGVATEMVKKKGADAVAKAMLRSTGKGEDISRLLGAYVSGGGKKTPEIEKLISALEGAEGMSEAGRKNKPKKSLWSLMDGSTAKRDSAGTTSGSSARWNPSPELRLACADD